MNENYKQVIIVLAVVYVLYSLFVAERRSEDLSIDEDTAARRSRSIFSWIDILIGVAISAVVLRYAIKIF